MAGCNVTIATTIGDKRGFHDKMTITGSNGILPTIIDDEAGRGEDTTHIRRMAGGKVTVTTTNDDKRGYDHDNTTTIDDKQGRHTKTAR